MKTKFYTIFFILIGLIFGANLYAQKISFSNVNSSQFPLIKVNFQAEDAEGNPYENWTVDDFQVVDDGGVVDKGMFDVFCVDTTEERPLLITLVIDQSTSMTFDNHNQGTRWAWMLEAVAEFLKQMNWSNGTLVSCLTFAQFDTWLKSPFTNDADQILDALRDTQVYGETNYNVPFFGHYMGSNPDDVTVTQLFNEEDPYMERKRVVIFLTDGKHNANSSSLVGPVRVNEIVELMNNNGISVYGIVIQDDMYDPLAAICAMTNSQTKETAYTIKDKEELKSVYRWIAKDIQAIQFCTIEWIAKYGCTEQSRYRTAQLRCTRIQDVPNVNPATREYKTPENSVAKVNMSETILSFNDPDVNQSVLREIEFTPQNADFSCESFAIMPATTNFTVVDWNYPSGMTEFQPFVIPAGETRTVQIRFTQGAQKKYHKATLVLEGGPCPPSLTMVGGLSHIDIIYPDGGEQFTTCDVVNIKWGGVDRNVAVNLSYLDGENWKPIAANATGLSFDWAPPKPGDFLVRGVVSGKSSYMCAKRAGGPENAVARSIALDRKEFYYFITGWYEDVATFGEGEGAKSISAKNMKRNIYVAKYDTECGFINVRSFGGDGVDSAAGICSSPDPVDTEKSYLYFTGSCQQGAQFDAMVPSMPLEGKNYFYVAKMYSDNMNVSNVQVYGGDQMNQSFEAWGQKIRYVEDYNGQIYVQGEYKSERDRTFMNEFPLPSTNGQVRRFEAIFRASDLKLTSLHQGGRDFDDYSKSYVFDSFGNKYDCGAFENTKTIGDFELESAGKQDIYTSKWGSVPGSEDQSQDFFTVETPIIYFNPTTINFGTSMLGVPVPYIVEICNDGELPVDIESIINTNQTEFYLDSGEPTSIPAGQCTRVTLMFKPMNIGARTGQLIVNGECSPQIILTMHGEGTCGSEVMPLVDFGNVNIGTPKTEQPSCIFKNINPNDLLTFDMEIVGEHAADFYIDPSAIPGVVLADECLEIPIRFTPGGPGVRNARIVYTMPEGCFSDDTYLRGNGVDPNFPLDNVDFGLKRLETVNNGDIIINNQTSIAVYVNNAVLSNTSADNGFTLGAVTLPMEVPAGEQRSIPVTFIPTEEKEYTNTGLVTLDIMPNTPLECTISGTGFLPQLDVSYDCGPTVPYGEETNGTLRIENTSLNGDLQIDNIAIAGTSEYEWTSGNAPQNVTLTPGEDRSYQVTFNADQAGDRSVTFNINADTKPGPNLNDVYEITSLTIECESYGISYTQDFKMGGVLTCDSYKRDFVITNQNGETDLTITNVVVSGADALYFDVPFAGEITIPAGESHTFETFFTPVEERVYTASVQFLNDLNYVIEADLSGEGHIIHFTTTEKTVQQKPDESVNIPVYAKVGQLSYDVTDVVVQVSANPFILHYVDGSVNPSVNGWSFTEDYSDQGVITFNGNGILTTPFEGEMFKFKYKVFLGESKSTPVEIKSVQGECEVDFETLFDLEIKDICFAEGRLVIPGNVQYSLALSPNPTNTNFEIDFGVGLEAQTTIEMYNTMGERVRVFADEVLIPGEYNISIPVADIPSGVYIVRIQSGPYSETKSVVISK
jgi:hypothetical protein